MSENTLEIQIETTSQCPLDCVHCSSADLRSNADFHFEPKEYANFISSFSKKKHIWLTGGEPLSLKNLENIIKEFSNINKTTVGIFSCGCFELNGILNSISLEYAHALKNSGLKNCYISLYHYNQNQHDAITQKESYEKTIESIKNLDHAGVDCKIHLPITRFVAENYERVLSEISKLKISEIRLLKLQKVGNAKKNWHKIGVDTESQRSAVRGVLNSNFPFKITISGFPEITACRSFLGAQACQAGINLIYIDYEGDVFPCASLKKLNQEHLLGNIKRPKDFEQIIKKNTSGYHLNCLSEI